MVWLRVLLCLFLLSIETKHVCGQEAQAVEETETQPEKGQDELSDFSYEIDVSELEFYVKNETGRDILKQHFHSIPEGQRKPWTVGSSQMNMKKNRYNDLLAYDDTRVILELLPDDNSSDYINANYIDGYNGQKEYVATQGPLPNTINDFWRMVWQLKSHKIIMLANVIEHGQVKVEKYWPDVNGTYGDFIITTLSEKSFRDHVVRTFSIRKPGDTHSLIVRQFHYTGWPDFGVPQDPLSVVALVQQARKYRPSDTVPLIVHCSAGVGRTGTVILTDSCMQKALVENKIDASKRLNHMRDQRINVVEKEVQYIFAFEAIYNVLYGEGTPEYLKEFDDWYNAEFSEASDVTDSE